MKLFVNNSEYEEFRSAPPLDPLLCYISICKHPLLCYKIFYIYCYTTINPTVLYFKRHIASHLESWKVSANRKPIVLRGARQVGKTTLIRDFAQSYKNSILLNLEKRKDVRFFEDYEDVHTIKDALFLEHNISNSAISSTLLFIDEIQESPKAIQLLRYFYEELPALHVIAPKKS